MVEELSKLNPVVACFLIAAFAVCISVAVWQFWKTMRSNN